MSQNTQVVLIERRGNALWITINRAERRNALNSDVISGIHAAIVGARNDASIRAIVLTGIGDKAFCAGADLSQGNGVFAADLDEPTTDFGQLARAVNVSGIPLIARINGACVAGGMGLMALCDLAVVADHARFGLPEAKVGVFPMQVLVYLRKMIAPRHVNYLCLTGDLISAGEALEMGIVNRVVPYAQLDERVEALVASIAQTSPAAVRRGKYAIAAMSDMSFEAAIAFAETQITLVSRTEDAREGLAAFSDRRAPYWVTSTSEKGQND